MNRRNKQYEAIVTLKDVLNEHAEELRFIGISPDELGEWVAWQLRSLKGSSIYLKLALLTVLSSGEFVEEFGGWRFNMPATACCLANWRVTAKEYKKHKPIWGLRSPWVERESDRKYEDFRII